MISSAKHWGMMRLLQLMMAAMAMAWANRAVAGNETPTGWQVVAHPDAPSEWLASNELRAILQGEQTTWQDGSLIRLVLVDQEFSDVIIHDLGGFNRRLMLRHWRKLVFTGRGIMPLLVSDETEALRKIASIEGAIGFVLNKPKGIDVKPITIAKPQSTLSYELAN
jgi:hypothetical protein